MHQSLSLGTEEVAAQLGVSTETVYELVRNGSIPAFRVSKFFRFRQSDIDEYLSKVQTPQSRSSL
jgi:excisionase family DNA binding protein